MDKLKKFVTQRELSRTKLALLYQELSNNKEHLDKTLDTIRVHQTEKGRSSNISNLALLKFQTNIGDSLLPQLTDMKIQLVKDIIDVYKWFHNCNGLIDYYLQGKEIVRNILDQSRSGTYIPSIITNESPSIIEKIKKVLEVIKRKSGNYEFE